MRRPLFAFETFIRECCTIARLAGIVLAIGIWIVALAVWPPRSERHRRLLEALIHPFADDDWPCGREKPAPESSAGTG
jgi:hypothetical protein